MRGDFWKSKPFHFCGIIPFCLLTEITPYDLKNTSCFFESQHACWWLQYIQIPHHMCISLIHKLTHWGRVTHLCVSKQTIIGSDNGLSPSRRQAIIWTNAGILLIGTLGTNFSEILIKIRICSFKKMGLKMSSAKWRPFCLGLKVLTPCRSRVILGK